MIAVKIHSGLGNQLFQYAFGANLAKRHSTTLLLDASYPMYYPLDVNEPPQKFHLPRFSGDFSASFDLPLVKYVQNLLPARALKKIYFASRLYKIKQFDLSMVIDDLTTGVTSFSNLPDNCYLDGYFQYPSLFDETFTKDLFAFEKPEIKDNVHLLVRSTTDPVSVNLRFGEYLNPTNLTTHGTCPIDYYRKAIQFICQKITNPTFFVFSDDIPKAKEFLSNLDTNFTYLNDDPRKDILSDLYLMLLCKHLIVANSSYSWWAAYLNKYEQKIVIAPNQWVINQKWQQYNQTIIPRGWIRL